MPESVTAGYRAMSSLLRRSHLAAQHHLPAIIASAAGELGAREATAFLVDLQQTYLIPFVASPASSVTAESLSVQSTVAGRAYQHGEVLVQAGDTVGAARLWTPLLDGTERLGVLMMVLDGTAVDEAVSGGLREAIERFAGLVAEILTSKSAYGDEIVRLRRRAQMGLAAELQWSLLPPLTFACRDVTVAGALEPAYRVAGDTLDYAVDAGVARTGVFDGMGHGLRSSQLATVAVAAYRNGRRTGAGLLETAQSIDDALMEAFGGAALTTCVLSELDTDTGTFTWVNAGHPPPLLLRHERVVKTLECRPRAPLGIALPEDSPARHFTVGREQLEPGDRVLLYTDGVTDARSPDGEFFGEARLTDLLIRNFAARLPGPETMRRVVRSLLDHQQGQLADDATMVLIEWRPGTAEKLLPENDGAP